jgi:nucleoside-diphosphate-sugar epimerase
VTTLIVGCGYLGQRLGSLLVERGERVLGTVRSESHAAEIASIGIEPLIADVLKPTSLKHLPAAEHVFYCVGYDRSAGAPLRLVYVDGLQNVLDHLPTSVTRLVYASSTGVFGQTEGEWVDEESAASPQHESGRACLEAERRALEWAAAQTPPAVAVVLRFAGLYGPGRLVRRPLVEHGEPIPGDPSKFLNLIHIDDAAQAAAVALTTARPHRVYVVSDDRPVTREEYYSRMASILGAPTPRYAPAELASSESARDATNKRVCNRRMKLGLVPNLQYPDITTGLVAALEANSSS